MRTIAILTVSVAAITITVLAYNLVRKDPATGQLQAVIPQTGATFDLEVQDKLDKLAGVLGRYQKTNQEQWQRAQTEQARLNRTLTTLETRLRSLETAGGEQTTDATLADGIEQATDTAVADGVEQATDTAESDSGAGDTESGRMSETDLGHWMDETLSGGHYRDEEWTGLAREETLESLAEAPDVKLEDMQCREDFCRATFADRNGEQPAIQELFGEPPFLNEGFTLEEGDGRVSVYFTRPGVSLGEIRSEALEAVQLGLSW